MDKLPAIPFTLLLLPLSDRSDEVKLETVVNKATNEQFSVSHDERIEVNRTRASKKKEKISKQNEEVIYRYEKVLCSSGSIPRFSSCVRELIRGVSCSIL